MPVVRRSAQLLFRDTAPVSARRADPLLDRRIANPQWQRATGFSKMEGMGSYRDAYQTSINDPERFWADQAGLITWIKKPKQILDSSNAPFYRWFPDATLNTCYNALDRHVVAGNADRTALIYDSPVTDTKQSLTYAQLLERVAAFAGALKGFGVEKGDRVVIYMPMIPEAVVAM